MTIKIRIEVVEDGINEAIVILQGKEDRYPHVELVQEQEVITKFIPGQMAPVGLEGGLRRINIRCWEGGTSTGWNDLKID